MTHSSVWYIRLKEFSLAWITSSTVHSYQVELLCLATELTTCDSKTVGGRMPAATSGVGNCDHSIECAETQTTCIS